MPPRRKKSAPSKRAPQPLPQNSCWVESDAYDRRAYANLRAESSSLRVLEENGGTFLPHFSSLLQDIFCLLFKYNIIFHEDRDLLASALFNRVLLRALHQSGLYRILRDLTLLDEAKSGLCALLLGEALLTLLKSEKLLTRSEMLDLWDISKQEEIREQKREDQTEAERLSQEPLAAKGKKSLDEARKMIEGEFDGAEALLRQ